MSCARVSGRRNKRKLCRREDWVDVLEPVMQLDSTLQGFLLGFFLFLLFEQNSLPLLLEVFWMDDIFSRINSAYSSGLPLHKIMYYVYLYNCWGTFQLKFILSCEAKWHWNAIISSAIITMATAAGRQGKPGILILYHTYTSCFSSLSVMTVKPVAQTLESSLKVFCLDFFFSISLWF